MGLFESSEGALREEYKALLQELCMYTATVNIVEYGQMTGTGSFKPGMTSTELAETRRMLEGAMAEHKRLKTLTMLGWAGGERTRMSIQRQLAPSTYLDDLYDQIERSAAQQVGLPIELLRQFPLRQTPGDFFRGR